MVFYLYITWFMCKDTFINNMRVNLNFTFSFKEHTYSNVEYLQVLARKHDDIFININAWMKVFPLSCKDKWKIKYLARQPCSSVPRLFSFLITRKFYLKYWVALIIGNEVFRRDLKKPACFSLLQSLFTHVLGQPFYLFIKIILYFKLKSLC